MTQYVGCDHARTLLEGLIDGELSMADQLAVESHLRWCDTCALRVSDMRLIGESLRSEAAGRPLNDAEDDTLNVLTDGLLVRVRAEEAQSLPSRIREMFADNHLLWPAVGAASAVLLCVAASVSVLHASTVQTRDSLAGLISVIGAPGTEKWPLRPADNGITIPRISDNEACRSIRCQDAALRASDTLEQIPEDDAIYTFRAVIGRDGSIGNYEFLSDDIAVPADRHEAARNAKQELALINAVRNTRFVPAQTPLGQAVAVDVVLIFAKTTAVVAPEPIRRSAVERPREAPKPQQPAGPPVSEQPATPRRSATA
jgi:hypothetical protein